MEHSRIARDTKSPSDRAAEIAAAIAFAGGVGIGLATPVFALSLGSLRIVILPLSAAFIAALVLNIGLHHRLGKARHAQIAAGYSAALGILLLPFVIKLGALVGQSKDEVIAAGPALLLQEAGHFLGTLILSMPIALFVLKLGREAVGASFSIARESSVAIISEKYGIRSPEGNGVMAVYVSGTLFGTIIFSILASLIASFDLFDYRALAVACGIGSGSMTAACGGSLAALRPAQGEEILGLAAASNLLSSIGGFYLTLFVTLPLANWVYRLARGRDEAARAATAADEQAQAPAPAPYAVKICLGMLAIGGAVFSASGTMAGFLWLTGLSGLSLILGRYGGNVLPAAFWASILGAVATFPGSPIAHVAGPALIDIDILVLATVPLAAAALTLGRGEWTVVRTVGWKLLVVALLVFLGTFLGAAVVAEIALKMGE